MSGLTLCMIVKNEEHRLDACLDSVTAVVDEIVLVDTGSTDGTVRVAERRGARVLRYPFPPVDFAAARNVGLAAAHGRTLLVLDADEILHPGSVDDLRALAAEDDDVGWVVTRRNFAEAGVEPAWVDHAVRVFPNRPAYRYRHRVHETVDESLLAGGARLRVSRVVLDHRLGPARDQAHRWTTYVGLLREELTEHPDDAQRLVFLMSDYYKLGRFAEATQVAVRVAELAPADFDAQFQAALCLHHYTCDRRAAMARVRAALALRPGDGEALELARRVRGSHDVGRAASA